MLSPYQLLWNLFRHRHGDLPFLLPDDSIWDILERDDHDFVTKIYSRKKVDIINEEDNFTHIPRAHAITAKIQHDHTAVIH